MTLLEFTNLRIGQTMPDRMNRLRVPEESIS
jgi:hypothetical protein